MVAVANGKADKINEITLNRLEGYGYIRKTASGYEPNILVFRKEKCLEMSNEAREKFETLRIKAGNIVREHYLFCREQIYNEIPDFLKNNEFQIDHACANIMNLRGAVLEEAIKQGYLSYDECGNKRMLGAYLAL